jgi:hypothetical protein
MKALLNGRLTYPLRTLAEVRAEIEARKAPKPLPSLDAVMVHSCRNIRKYIP